MKNARCLTITNQKGGIAKTTTTLALISLIAAEGKKVLAVDLDGQGNLTATLTQKKSYDFWDCGLYAFVENFNNDDDDDKTRYIHKTHIENVDIMPASKNMEHMGTLLETHSKVIKKQPYELIAKYLEGIVGGYDLVICDTPPDWLLLIKSGIYMANAIIVPFEADEYSKDGLEATVANVNMFKKEHPSSFSGDIIGIVNIKRKKNVLTDAVLMTMQDTFSDLITKTSIRESQACREAPTFGKTVIEHAPRCNTAVDYTRLYAELKKKIFQ